MIKVLKAPLWNYDNFLVSKYNTPSLISLKRKYCAITKRRDFKDVLRTSLLSKNPVIIFSKSNILKNFNTNDRGRVLVAGDPLLADCPTLLR